MIIKVPVYVEIGKCSDPEFLDFIAKKTSDEFYQILRKKNFEKFHKEWFSGSKTGVVETSHFEILSLAQALEKLRVKK